MNGLCFRCEHRAMFCETEQQPRYECGQITFSVSNCYMFKPVKPITIKANKGDSRPVSLNVFSARIQRIENDIELILEVKEQKEGILVYWKPKE